MDNMCNKKMKVLNVATVFFTWTECCHFPVHCWTWIHCRLLDPPHRQLPPHLGVVSGPIFGQISCSSPDRIVIITVNGEETCNTHIFHLLALFSACIDLLGSGKCLSCLTPCSLDMCVVFILQVSFFPSPPKMKLRWPGNVILIKVEHKNSLL